MRDRAFDYLNPHDDPDLFEHVIVDYMESPGRVTLMGHDRVERWEKEKAANASGEVLNHKGPDVKEFQLSFELIASGDDEPGQSDEERWEKEKAANASGEVLNHKGPDVKEFQLSFELIASGDDEPGQSDEERWEEFQALLESSVAGPEPIALFIYHPDLARNRITSVVFVSCTGFQRKSGGVSTVVVTLRPYDPEAEREARKPAPGGTGGGAKVPGSASTPEEPKPDPNAAAKQELAALVDEAEQP